jgi:ABC-2 type transport system permease protein
VLSGLVLALLTGAEFLSLGEILLLSASQLPILLTNVFLGILFGTIFNDKTAPGICSVFISAAGVLGGCWMPLETMGGFETLCRCLPFYPSVYLGRIFTNATNALGGVYAFNSIAALGLIPIFLCLFGSIFATFFAFKRQMTER